MPQAKTEPHIQTHRDGGLWVKGKTLDGPAHGHREWYRRDGVRLRSGSFERGEQTGTWTTCEKSGGVDNITIIKPKTGPSS